MTNLFSKLIGIKPNVTVLCSTNTSCAGYNYEATYRIVNGNALFYHCGC